MSRGIRLVAAAGLLAAASLVIRTTVTAQGRSAAAEVMRGQQLLIDARYREAILAFQSALVLAPNQPRDARAGIVLAALRVGLFEHAKTQAEILIRAMPNDPYALTVSGDALWAAGMFQESEARYAEALNLDPGEARAMHGIARSLAAQGRINEALMQGERALVRAPADGELHYTVGAIYERRHQFREAADAYERFVKLLPKRDRTDRVRWARSHIAFLRSFERRQPYEMDAASSAQAHTIDFRIENEKIIVRARVNDEPMHDFVVDTGAEYTVLSRSLARRFAVQSIATTIGSGVGEHGLRHLQLARIDTIQIGSLKVHNVPAIIKDPALRNAPVEEVESLSPLSFGLSMIVDYQKQQLTFGRNLPHEPSDFELPLRFHRLAVVRGMVDGQHATNFVVDTGGQVISISNATADRIGREPVRRIPLKVFGSSGWDRDAFLMPDVDLAFDEIRFPRYPVVVLNLTGPSVLLGFQLGGTVGHSFLSKYRFAIDLDDSVLRLKRL